MDTGEHGATLPVGSADSAVRAADPGVGDFADARNFPVAVTPEPSTLMQDDRRRREVRAPTAELEPLAGCLTAGHLANDQTRR